MLLKLHPVRQRGYIEAGSGKVKSLINYFWVTGSAAVDVEEVVRNVRALPRTVDVAARRLAGGPLRRGRPTGGSQRPRAAYQEQSTAHPYLPVLPQARGVPEADGHVRPGRGRRGYACTATTTR